MEVAAAKTKRKHSRDGPISPPKKEEKMSLDEKSATVVRQKDKTERPVAVDRFNVLDPNLERKVFTYEDEKAANDPKADLAGKS